MKIRIILLAASLASAGVASNAQTPPAKQPAAPTYQKMDLTDLKVDIKQLMGKRISVSASAQQMGEMTLLKSDPMDMAPVWGVTEGLPRDDRKKLASGCQMVLCGGQFYGVVKQGPMGPSVMVEKVEWR